MKLWNAVHEIDKKYTKTSSLGGRNVTSFSLASVVKMATEQFGLFGKGWGYEVMKERFDEGNVIQEAVTFQNGDVQPQIKSITHTLLIRLWYVWEDEKVTCPIQAGHTPYLMSTKYGIKHDEEYYKKTLADAIKKSLSMLGFGADIFLGLMEDQEYQRLKDEEKQMRESNELPKKIEEFGADVMKMITFYSKANQSSVLDAMYKGNRQKIYTVTRQLGISPEKYLAKIKTARDDRFNELKEAYEKSLKENKGE